MAEKKQQTKQEIEQNVSKSEWIEYRSIQDSGMFNMYDPNARAMTDISRDTWIYIIKHYSEIKELYYG